MKVISADQVHQALTYPDLVRALIEHHLNEIDEQGDLLFEQPNGKGDNDVFLTLPAWQCGRAMGAKLITVFPDNEHNNSGLPSVQGVYVLFDGKDGKPLAVIDGTALTLKKTAADSALGSYFLAREDTSSLLMVGAGAMAPHLIEAHIAVRPTIDKVLIWNRTQARATQLAEALSISGVEIGVSHDIEADARRMDLISCATMSDQPLIRGDWLKPGAHLDLVGSYKPSMHECDEKALVRSSVFVDSPWSAMEDCGEMISAIASDALSPDDITGNNFTLSRGEHPGRSNNEEITLFKNGGGGHLDLMVAQYLCSVIN